MTGASRFQRRRQRKRIRKKSRALDLTNAPVKRQAAQASRRGLAARLNELQLRRGIQADLRYPPVYQVEQTRRNVQASPDTQY